MKQQQITLLLLIIGFTQFLPQNVFSKEEVKKKIEVLYFHGKHRCATCISIEKATKELITTSYKQQVKEGRVQYRIIDISKKENSALVKKHKVAYSSLILCKKEGKKEVSKNLTSIAFKYARKQPDLYKKTVQKEINQLLK